MTFNKWKVLDDVELKLKRKDSLSIQKEKGFFNKSRRTSRQVIILIIFFLKGIERGNGFSAVEWVSRRAFLKDFINFIF